MNRRKNGENALTVELLENIPDIFRRFNVSGKNGNFEIYAQEFAYSAIYGNLKQSNIDLMLELLGLEHVPNLLMLVRVDSCGDMFRRYPEFNVFPLKGNIVNEINKYLVSSGREGFAANFPGRDTIAVFLWLEGSSVSDKETRDLISETAGNIIAKINQSIGEAISIGIGDFCSNLSRFPKAYSECKEALNNSFRYGKCQYSFFGDDVPVRGKLDNAELSKYFLEIVACLNKSSLDKCEIIINKMTDFLCSKECDIVSVKLYVINGINHINEHFTDYELENASLNDICLNAIMHVLNCNFLQDISTVLHEMCNAICDLKSASCQDDNAKIKMCIDDCISKMYSKNDFCLAEAAELNHYSTSYFGRMFNHIYGVSFSKYLSEYRIEQAKRILNLGKTSLNDVAFEVGFSSASYFCTVFKNVTGMSPKQYIAGLKSAE